MSGKGYTPDDNRSMQLNPNNERYYSSRGGSSEDDWGYDEPLQNNNMGDEIMLLEINDEIINFNRVTKINSKVEAYSLERKEIFGYGYKSAFAVNLHIAVNIHTDYSEEPITLKLTSTPFEEYPSDYINGGYPRINLRSEQPLVSGCVLVEKGDLETEELGEETKRVISGLNTWVRKYFYELMRHQKDEVGS